MPLPRAMEHPNETPTIVVKEGEESTLRTQRDPEDMTGLELADGRYLLLKVLGRGGMGFVYEAQHTKLRKAVAVKVLSHELSQRPDWVERFLREGRAASKVDHENVVAITDFGTTPRGSPFIAMELLKGEPLSKTISDQGPLPWVRAKRIVLQICRALHAAHTKGVIHRDMKPENCFRTKHGSNRDFIKVLDFGLAKVFGDEADPVASLTNSGAVFGTPVYMSPEQAHGKRADHRTDVYSVGLMLYEMVTATLPFHSDNFVRLLTMHALEEPDPPSSKAPEASITPDLDAVVLRALAKDPDKRYQTMRELAEAIAELPVNASANPSTTLREPVAGHQWGRRQYRLLIGGLGIAIAALTVALTILLSAQCG